ncbi:microvitellogenin-like [Manduca sexta]|uniref:microvitellogenin-like n=1 Tax=Manduca sexta TaxID=7130 RepID=UPI00188FAE79|nr:microvitellogenin-like [Manduca sexta]
MIFGQLTTKIINKKFGMELKIGLSTDSYGERTVYGVSTDNDIGKRASWEFTHQWYLQPVVVNKELLFYIINREYDELLKLSQSPDSDGDREAFTHGEDASGDPERFGWKIERY